MALLLTMGLMFLGSAPIQASSLTQQLTAKQRLEARRNKRLSLTSSSQGSSQSSLIRASLTVKPRCKKANEVKWSCGSCSVCTNNGASWTQICQCYIDPSSTCFVPGGGLTSKLCTPTAAQSLSLKQQEQQKEQEASLSKFQSDTESEYRSMVNTQKTMDSMLPLYDGTTSMQLFQINNQLSGVISQMKIYNDKAERKLLQLSDMPAVTDILNKSNDLMDRFLSIAKAAGSIPQSTSTQNIYVIPVFAPTQTSPTVDCVSERRKINKLSGGHDMSGLQYLRNLGCN